VSNVGGLETGALDYVVDDGGEIVDTNLLDGPGPVAGVGAREVTVRHLKVGTLRVFSSISESRRREMVRTMLEQ
jgi:hypothetical protein